METIKAVVEKGVIVPREPVEWPDGTELDISVVAGAEVGLFDDTPESVAKWVALAESIPAPVISDEEWEAMQERRRQNRERELGVAARDRDAGYGRP